MNAKAYWHLVKDAGSAWLEDKAPRLGAALAYYAAFSLAPLLIIVIGIAGLVLGQDAAGRVGGPHQKRLDGCPASAAVPVLST